MKRLVALLVCVLLLSGCTKSTIVTPDKGAPPDMSIKENIEIDWNQAGEEAQDIFLSDAEYPYSAGIGFDLNSEKKEILLVWVVYDDIPKEVALNYAEILAKEFNNIVAVQDFSIEQSSETSYGGLWQRYAVTFGIAPESTKEDSDTWFVNNRFDAGQEITFTVNENAAFQE